MKPGPEVSICAVWQAKEYKKRTQKICATSTTIPGGEALYNPKSQAVIGYHHLSIWYTFRTERRETS